MTRVLVVGGGPYQLDLIHTARRMGLETVVVDGNLEAPGLALADVPVVCDIIDGPAVVAVARREGIEAVVSGASDAALVGLSAVVDALALPGPSSAVIARIHDKLAAARTVRAAGLACPETVLFAEAEGDAAVDAVGGFPLVVKPATAAGGRGVSLLREASGLTEAVAKARRHCPHVLLQRWVGGRSLGVEAFFHRGVRVAHFVMSDQYARPFVSPVGHGLPAAVDPELAAKIEAAIAGWAAALGLSDGAANFDLRIEDGVPTLIEVNPRLGGNSITRLIRAGVGADPSAAALACALGRSPAPHLTRTRARAVASRMFVGRGRGPVSIMGEPLARWTGHALELQLDVAPGKVPALRVDEFALLGRCLVEGPDAEAAAALTARIAEDVQAAVRCDDPDPEDGR